MSQELNFQTGAISIGGKQVPVWSVNAPASFNRTKLAPSITDALGPAHFTNLFSSCRGVTWERLSVILATGCDVEPSDSPIFASSLEKALEYGHDQDQVIQVFDHGCLRPSFRERAANLTVEERTEIEKVYPTLIPSEDGSRLWFTRLAPDDPRAATGYEREYGYWIPGNPIKALCALIVISSSSDPSRFGELFPQFPPSSTGN